MKKAIISIVLLFTSYLGFSQDIFDAARQNDTTQLQALLQQGIHIDTVDASGYTPLIIAVYNDNKEATQMLIAKGAQVDAKDKSGNTALMGAIFKGQKKLHYYC